MDEYKDGVRFQDLPETENKRVVETADQAESRRLARLWKAQIEDYDRKNAKFINRGGDIQLRFRDDRSKKDEDAQRKFNSLYAWFETIRPACYSQTPKPAVERKFQDKDPLGRKSAQILERVLSSQMKVNGFHTVMERVVNDYLLPGRGIAWVRYEPIHGESDSISPTSRIDMEDAEGQIMPKGEDETNTDNVSNGSETEVEDKLEDTGKELLTESVPVDYVDWKDFRIFPTDARSWQEVTAVSKDIYLSKDDCIKHFPDIGHKIEPEGLEPKRGLFHDKIIEVEDKDEKKRRITEIWDRNTLTVLWVSQGYQHLCGKMDDPLKLKHFFPCPEPLQSITTTDTLIPVPFYHQWEDQAKQRDDITQKISMLTKALQVKGFYDAAAQGLSRLLNESGDLAMIPIKDWTQIGEKGIDGIISFYPTEVIAQTLAHTIQQRKEIDSDIDLITGIGDVVRGTGDARETKGGVTLKANASGTRVEAMRKNVGRFASELTNIIGEVISTQFSDKTLAEESGIFFEEGIDNDLGLIVLEKMELDPSIGARFQQMGQPTSSPMMMPPPQQQPTLSAQQYQQPNGQQQPQAQPAQMGIGNSYTQPNPATGNPAAPMGATPPPPSTALAPQAMGSMPQQAPQPSPQFQQIQQFFATVNQVKDAIDLLRSDIHRSYRIEVEVDTMIAGDQQQKRQDANDFLATVTGYIEKTGLSQSPHWPVLAGKFLTHGARAQGVGRDLEQSIEEFADAVAKDAQNPQQKGPSPEQIKMQIAQAKGEADIKRTQMQTQSDAAQAQAEIQRQQLENQGEAFNSQQDTRQKMIDAEIQKMQMQIELTKLQIEKVKAEAALRSAHIDASQSMMQHYPSFANSQ